MLTAKSFTVLVVAATEFELADLRERLGGHLPGYEASPAVVFDYLSTGVGPVATSFALTRKLVTSPPDVVVNVGLAGALAPELPLGYFANVTTDTFGDLGAEDRDGSHLDLVDLGLAAPDEFPFVAGRLPSLVETGIDPTQPRSATLTLLVGVISDVLPDGHSDHDGVTVSQAHGSAASIEKFRDGNDATLESMEGAAVFYVARQLSVPCLQFRAVSNRVEPRDRDAWDIPLALRHLAEGVGFILESFAQEAQAEAAAPPPRDR